MKNITKNSSTVVFLGFILLVVVYQQLVGFNPTAKAQNSEQNSHQLTQQKLQQKFQHLAEEEICMVFYKGGIPLVSGTCRGLSLIDEKTAKQLSQGHDLEISSCTNKNLCKISCKPGEILIDKILQYDGSQRVNAMELASLFLASADTMPNPKIITINERDSNYSKVRGPEYCYTEK